MNHNHEVWKNRVDDTGWTVVCVQCGQSFEAKRSDAAFCSPRCRVSHSREPIKKANAIQRLQDAALDAEQTAKRYKFSDEVFQEMLKAYNRIGKALMNFEKV